jgi:hypothetical protein
MDHIGYGRAECNGAGWLKLWRRLPPHAVERKDETHGRNITAARAACMHRDNGAAGAGRDAAAVRILKTKRR